MSKMLSETFFISNFAPDLEASERMKFFRKSAPEEKRQPVAENSFAPVTPPTESNHLTAEEEARHWVAGHFGTDMPEEVTRLFRHVAQTEAKRQKAGEQVLDANELKRIQESMRFYKTKLTNITQTLDGLQSQKEWLHKYQQLNSTLEKFRQAFFESNKKYNARLQDLRELERFEAFDAVRGNYESIRSKEKLLQQLRDVQTEQAVRMSEAQDADKAAEKQAEASKKKRQEGWNALKLTLPSLAEGYRLQALLQAYTTDIRELNSYKDHIAEQLTSTQDTDTELADALKKVTEKSEKQQQLQQNLASQQRMLEVGDVILTKLAFLQSLKKRKEQVQAALERTLKQQHEQDEKLNRLFAASQDTEAQINSLQSELQVHLKSILGMNSYSLQQRAMDLKSRREMLTHAAQLWKQIAEGYARVDEKSQEIMRMKHHNDALKAEITQTETETKGLLTQCEELKYAYTLSKSQDIMQLRKDLQEGVSCSVCGATHHPYHSDTLLEQSKLIGEIKREFEQASTELKHKQTRLTELRQEQGMEEGRIEMGYQALETYKQILKDNVEHWNTFIPLDRSFKDCSASTNFEGRRIMLQQLSEKTGLDAEEAQKELDRFNYHQSCINSLNKKISQKEQEKNDLAIRVNEVNTSCQVLAYRVEQLQRALTRNNGYFSEMYEEIDSMMAISNWYKVWTENAETLRVYIQQQKEHWCALKEEMNETRQEYARLQACREMNAGYMQSLNKQLDDIANKIGQMSEYRDQADEQLHKLFRDSDVDAYSKTLYSNIIRLEVIKEETADKAYEAHALAEQTKGCSKSTAETIQLIEADIAKERSDLDIWIRKYNADHSPVQFSELEQTFNETTDWNALRKELRALTLNNMLAEARVEEARVAIAAHQVNALSQGQDKEDRTAALNTEIARLESEQNNILVKIAGCQAQLDAHEAGLQKLAAGEHATDSQATNSQGHA